MERIYWGHSTSCFVNGLVFQVIIEKALCSKDFKGNKERFLYENNRNYNSYSFSYKFALITVIVFLEKAKTRIKTWTSCWSGNKKYFCCLFTANRALLLSYIEFNRLLLKYFFHVIPTRFIVPCSNQPFLNGVLVILKTTRQTCWHTLWLMRILKIIYFGGKVLYF